MFTLSRSCAQGDIFNCPCINKSQIPITLPPQSMRQIKLDETVKTHSRVSNAQGQFKWGGCIDNIKWAMKMTRNFVDSSYKRIRSGNSSTVESRLFKMMYMNRHNNKIGRKVIFLIYSYKIKIKKLICYLCFLIYSQLNK